ncbi:MAG: IS110 family transposase [Azonexus sp.]
MILPAEEEPRNQLSRKSQKKALDRGQGQTGKKKRKEKQVSADSSPESASEGRRGGRAIPTAPSLDQLEQVNRNAAGIDLGAAVHYVAVPPGRDPEGDVRCFDTFTPDLEAIADWLKRCKVETVAMESTGVYWIPLYDLLEQRGFEVLLINPADFKKFRRKTDVSDCQWLQILHTFGLLRGSFRPDEKFVELRAYLRHRDNLVKCASDEVRRMQKALEQMNVKLTEVITDITGVTGMAIIRAILAGERNPVRLAGLRDKRCRNDVATIARALQGNWREEHLFALRQGLELYEVYLQKLADLDKQLETCLGTFEDRSGGAEELSPSHRSRALEPTLNLRDLTYKLTGVDLTEVDGIAGNAALQIVAEIGTDMSKWDTDKHFVSWLCLCPELHLSGGSRKSKGSRTHASKNRVAGVLRMCAQSLLRCDCALGAFGRRLRAKKCGAIAVTAVARKLAIIVYHMLKERRPYKDQGADYYEARYRERVVEGIRRRAKQLGLDVVPLATAP